LIALVIPKGDLEIVNGTTQVIEGQAYAKQRVSVSLDFFLGEWFLDTRQGMTYFRDVLIKNPNTDTVRSVFRRAIMKTPGIVGVPVLDVTLDTTNRKAIIEWQAVWKDGQIIPGDLELVL
jgi:hypothetical protein